MPPPRIVLTVGGRRVELARDEVTRKLRQISPGRVREHVVEVEGVEHPVKEAFAAVTGLDIADFNTNQARAAFKRLGFPVTRRSSSETRRAGLGRKA